MMFRADLLHLNEKGNPVQKNLNRNRYAQIVYQPVCTMLLNGVWDCLIHAEIKNWSVYG